MNSQHSYVQLSGDIFSRVQMNRIFNDAKTFPDSVPRSTPNEIRNAYRQSHIQTREALEQFILTHFELPVSDKFLDPDTEKKLRASNMTEYTRTIWPLLMRNTDKNVELSTLIPLPYPYVVPGGRFREIYYWDSFFTCLGLLKTEMRDSVLDMCRNFAYLIDTVGHVPNGNRVYYISRSQPPVFALMIDMLERKVNEHFVFRFIPQLLKEYDYWMNGKKQVTLDNNIHLNRYHDYADSPREEGYYADVETASNIHEQLRPVLYRNIRSAAESGWDFSSRWLGTDHLMSSIQTTDIIPVDLNCLLYFMEYKLSLWLYTYGYIEKAKLFKHRAENRATAIQTYFWSETERYYFDYNFKHKKHTDIYSLAAVYPLFFGIATQQQAKQVAKTLADSFLYNGGLVTTLHKTTEQWDFPQGWAPLQWLAIQGLYRYGYDELGSAIRNKWIQLNQKIYEATGYMFEKYDVVDETITSHVGEYGIQIGFGWTNGVLLDLLSKEYYWSGYGLSAAP